MDKKKFLLSDETNISTDDFIERKRIYQLLSHLPEDFFSKIRHLQPQIGCLNACKICSKDANCCMSYWTEKRQRNVISAIKVATLNFRNRKPYICWDRANHRNGVIFSYLDNDVGNYYYLDTFIKLAYQELGVVTRISTVGYSRHNSKLNEVHRKINTLEYLHYLGGVRISFTPYAIGWNSLDGRKFHRVEYINDMANILKIYKPYYDFAGAGNRKFCVEIRYKPLVCLSTVFDFEFKNHKIIATHNYLFISKKGDLKMDKCYIKNPDITSISLTTDGEVFYEFNLCTPIKNQKVLENYLNEIDFEKINHKRTCVIYMLENREGIYYSINPHLTENGNDGLNIYPVTSLRKKSGYIITERFFLNALLCIKKEKSKFTWKDVNEVINICQNNANCYMLNGKREKSIYIMEEVIPMIKGYARALRMAGYSANEFFDENFTIDTGIICNLGRALGEFAGLTNYENEPLTPVHEKNYGKINSKMTKEDYAWRLSCGYNDHIVIEKLELRNTATEEGQVKFQKVFSLKKLDEKNKFSDLNDSYLIPGQVPANKMYFYKEKGPLGYLASYSKYGFKYHGIYWPTLEHYYQAQKFSDEDIQRKILNASTPKEASQIGRNRNYKIKQNWDDIRNKIMYEGIYLKFKQNENIKMKLIKTDNTEIIEGTTKESYWGCDIDGSGENNFGRLLMKARKQLIEEERRNINETNRNNY